MPRKDIMDAMRKYTDPFRVTKGKDFRLKDFDPGDTLGLKMDKQEAAELLQRGSEWLAMEQDILYAQDSWSVLLVFQAMDAAGKDGTIKHVMSRINPQGCDVHLVQAALATRSCRTISYGAIPRRFRSAVASESSTAPTTRRSSSCACIRSS